MRVVLAAEVSGSRDGKSWPPAGSEVDLPEDEALGLIKSGAARAVKGDDTEYADKSVDLDPETAARVNYATTTRDRRSVSKRAHEPLNPGLADPDQPAEDDPGQRAPEVAADESAAAQDPARASTVDNDEPVDAVRESTKDFAVADDSGKSDATSDKPADTSKATASPTASTTSNGPVPNPRPAGR